MVLNTGDSNTVHPDANALVRVERLKVRYANGAIGVIDVSLDIQRSSIVALLGPNGAGKTTTARAITGFLRTERARVVHGSVSAYGRDSTNLEPHVLSGMGMAFVPERNKVFGSLTVVENLAALGPKSARRVSKADYDRVFQLFPVLAERKRQTAGSLSGGQQQMLALARAAISKPSLLVVDEMTMGLHHSLHSPLFDFVKQIASEGTAVLMVDESTGFALKTADTCYLMNGGRVRDHGPASKFVGNELLAAGYVE